MDAVLCLIGITLMLASVAEPAPFGEVIGMALIMEGLRK